MTPVTVRALSIHADYRCGRTGVCCASGWAIPVEAPLHERLLGELRRGGLTAPHPPDRLFAGRPDLPRAYAAVLGVDEAGRCLFHDAGGTCGIQRQKGHAWLPGACRQFPRVSLLDDRGVHVSLSHYCPTAARTLLRDDVDLRIEDGPSAYPADGEYEGLDARGALPPLLEPDLLMDLDGYDVWERHVVSVFAAGCGPPEAALGRLASDVEVMRAWRPGGGPLADRVRATASRRASGVSPPPGRPDWIALDLEVRASVPAATGAPPPLTDAGAVWARLVAPGWPAAARPVRRYLAARAFGAWVAYEGRGLRTYVRSLAAALAVVRMEAARACARAGRKLDEPLLVEAVRAADLLLLHLADREALARAWSDAEQAG